MVTFSDSMQILSLELFDAAFAIEPGTEDEVRRRFMTLFVSESSVQRGGSAQVCRATNARGESFALKRLRAELSGEPAPATEQAPRRKELRHSVGSSGSADSPTPDYVTQGHVAAFYEEYRVHLAVSRLRGFAGLYGFGLAGGQPVIVMEWVEGTTLREALRARSRERTDPLPLDAVAGLGITVLELLGRAGELSESFVHRDLSPRNIMLRTDRVPAQEQFESASFDLCLIDFGSSALASGRTADPTFTMRTNIWRMGTPAYAPPEMLTSDVALPEGYRNSPAIDVYALCSVLFELYGGAQPFDLAARPGQSPYRIKTEESPRPLVPREPDGGALAAIIAAGLATQPEERPDTDQLRTALANWRELPSQRAIPGLGGRWHSDLSVWQPGSARRLITRRRFVSAGIVAASALVSGSFVARRVLGSRERRLDESRYPRAEALYQGPPLYLAFDSTFDGWALVTSDGSIACKPNSSRPCGPLREGLVALFDDISQRYGYVTPTGTGGAYAWAILPRYAQAADFSEGLAAAQDPSSGLWGYLDAQGAWAIEPQFDEAAPFSHGRAAVRGAGALWGAIGTDGGWTIEPSLATIGLCADDGLAAAQDDAGLWGIVDEAGDWVAQPAFPQLRRYHHGLALAFDAESARWGYVDARGSWALPPAYADARPFYEASAAGERQLAAVQDAATLLWHFIEPDGTAHTKPALWKLGDLRDSLAPAQATAEDDTVVFDSADPDSYVEGVGMRYGYVDEQGSWQMRRLATLADTRIGPAEV